DSSCKEQMAVVLRYVNKKGYVIERFLGIVHVTDTCSLSLKEALESLLATHELSMSRIRGQGYDGASNMRGEFNGLKSLILNDNKLVNVVGVSCKRRDMLLEKQVEKILEELHFKGQHIHIGDLIIKQRQDQDIVNSMMLVVIVKQSIDIPNMDDDYAAIGRPRRVCWTYNPLIFDKGAAEFHVWVKSP
ncbi:zinc finger MYM-type protein 1-like protein, partial [Tanacetum coccineum]